MRSELTNNPECNAKQENPENRTKEWMTRCHDCSSDDEGQNADDRTTNRVARVCPSLLNSLFVVEELEKPH